MISSTPLENGKYTLKNDNGILSVLRYGEPWRKEDLIGDNLFSSMLNRILEQEAILMDVTKALEQLARLGNGDHYGTSIGNVMAKDIIDKITFWKEQLK